MKFLFLVRHAKSSWSFDLPDHDRPLGKRGRKDVVKMGNYLAANHAPPDHLISSTASRAFYTALHFCDQFKVDESNIELNQGLFHAGAQQILNVIRSAKNCERLAVFGHNPGFTDCANQLTNSMIPNVPTCGVVGISFPVENWQDVSFGLGKQEFFYVPKGV
ncbi:MAG: histidine phosphatase family protein [Bacteroidota bacterium]